MSDMVFITCFWFFSGAMLASFAGVVAARLPGVVLDSRDGKSIFFKAIRALSTPASSCPHCGVRLKVWHLVPALSFVFLRGRCEFCKKPVPTSNLIAELILGLTLMLLWLKFGDGLKVGLLAVFFWFGLVLAWIDIEQQILLDELTLFLMWLGLLINLNGQFVPLPDAVLGAVVGYLSLWLIYQVFFLITEQEGLGYGDFKLFAAVGTWFGILALPLVIFIASGIALLYFAVGFITGKKTADKSIAFGPFIALATLAYVLTQGLLWW